MELVTELSESSLDALQSRLESFADGIEPSAIEGAAAIAEIAAGAARDACPSESGALRSSIHVERTESGADVVASSQYAAFVEFGTGIGTPSGDQFDAIAMSRSGYSPDASGKGDEGWTYPKDGSFRLTHGQSGKGFMATGAESARADDVAVMLSYVRGAM